MSEIKPSRETNRYFMNCVSGAVSYQTRFLPPGKRHRGSMRGATYEGFTMAVQVPLCHCHPCSEKCYNCVTSPRGLIHILGRHRFDRMIVKLTNAECDTILAALRRWQSYPSAREADSIATGGGKHRPLDNAEIERICKRLTKIKRKRDATPFLRQLDNGATEGQIEREADRQRQRD